ncbi:MAG: TIM barrel protein [Oscillospiraceae bacterium]|nr:TIM barrel protein [Oscillospiraceae bacterium]MBR3556358.1 TIM barrel protein [Oscillospiraceae bacterium]
MIQSMNFPLSPFCIKPYGSWNKLWGQIKSLGLTGIEAIADPEDLDDSLDPAMISGWHMVFYPDWLDFWRHDEKALLQKYLSWEEIRQAYRGTEPEALMGQFKDDLALAVRFKAPYVVFHVSDVSLQESFTYRWLHTDQEVLDGAIEFINEMLNGVEPTFDFLMENQWWPGFTFMDPEKTEYLLSRINYPRVGIMLDTGHLMNTNWRIKKQWDGIKYILEMIEKHGELSKSIYGLHFHQSVSGAYCRKVIGRIPVDFPREYLTAFGYSYPHIERIDRHRPWTDPDCVRIIDRVEPKYLTHELSSGPRRSQLGAVRRQLGTIRRGRENK